MQRASEEAARRRQQAAWQANALRAVQLNERIKMQARKLTEGWQWVDAAEGDEERERRETLWITKLHRYERDVDELRETERTLREQQATG